MMEVADQKPIFLARDEVVGIKGKITKAPSYNGAFKIIFLIWLQPESPELLSGHTLRPDTSFSRKD